MARPAFAGMTRMPSEVDEDNTVGRASGFEKWSRVRSNAVEFLRIRKTRYDELVIRRKERIKEVCIYSVFVILFTYVALSSRNTADAHYIVKTFRTLLEQTELPHTVVPNYFFFFADVSTIDDMWDYIEHIFVEVLFPGAANENSVRVPIMGNNVVVGRTRIRQVRVREQECATPKVFASRHLVCYPEFDKDLEETSFDPTGTWFPQFRELMGVPKTDNSTLVRPPYWMAYSRNDNPAFSNSILEKNYGNGGYAIEFNPKNLHQGYLDVQHARKVGWLNNNNTRAVFLEFAIYNPNVNLFTTAVLAFEVHATAGVYTESTWRGVNLARTLRTSSLISLALEFVLYAFVVFYFFLEGRNIRRLGRKEYFTDGYNYITWFNLLLFLCVAFLEAFAISQASDLLSREEVDLQNYELQGISFFTYQVYNWNSFNALLTWIRVVKYLDIISKKTKQLAGTLGRSATGVATLGIVFIIIYFGYSLAFYLAFGQEVETYRTVAQSTFSLFRAILGEFEFDKMYRANRVLGPILFVSYIAIIFFVLLNMFLAVIMKSYEETSIELEKQPDELSSFMRRQWKRGVTSYFGKKYRAFMGIGPTISDDSTLSAEEIEQVYHDDEDTFKELGIMNWQQLVAVADINDDNELSLEEITAFAKEAMGEKEEQGRELPYLLMKVVERTNNVIHEQKVVRSYLEKATKPRGNGSTLRAVP
jgi:hypothetical protein